MERLVVSRLVDDACCHHGFKCQLDPCFNHSDHENALVIVGLLVDVLIGQRLLFKRSCVGLGTPREQVDIVVRPVSHHGLREVTRHDVVLVLFKKRAKNFFHVFSEIVRLDFRRVAQTIHHISDAAVLETFRNRLPAILDKLCRIAWVDTQLDHAIKAKNRARLKHAAKNGLLAHEVRFNFRNERRFENPRSVTARTGSVGLCQLKALSIGVVLTMHGDESGYTKASQVFLANFCTGALRGHHNDGDVFTDLHAFFNDVEAVRVRQTRTLFHKRLYCVYHIRVLLIWRQV